MKSSSFVHLRQDGVSLLVSLAPELVRIIHWGEDLGDIKDFESYLAASIEPTAHAEGDSPDQSGIWREQARGAIGSPVLKGHRKGLDFSPLFVPTSHTANEQELVVVGEDLAAGLRIETSFSFVGAGVLVTSQTVTNIGSGDYYLEDLATYLPLPDRAQESLDFAGRWVKERQPVRREIQPGVVSREVREGRTSHDYTIMQLAMTNAATFRTG